MMNGPNDYWLKSSGVAIERALGRKLNTDYINERLAALLLERLPPELSRRLLSLLPPDVRDNLASLRASAESGPERSIGYPSFVERALHALGCYEFVLSEEEVTSLAIRITNAFLETVGAALPNDLRIEMLEFLPQDLRSRMALPSRTIAA